MDSDLLLSTCASVAQVIPEEMLEDVFPKASQPGDVFSGDHPDGGVKVRSPTR